MPNTPNRRFLFLLGSTRRTGNSELLARHAAEFLPPLPSKNGCFWPISTCRHS